MYKIKLAVVGVITALFIGGCAFLNLPLTDNLDNLHLVAATQVYDINGQLISKLFEENRIVVSINNISPFVQQAIIANEDSRFYQHIGLDPIGIVRAMLVNIRTGSILEGGSTLTQQLAKNMFLTQERTLSRKLKEAVLALIIERKFSKQEILQAYLNQVYFGEGAYGVEAAAQVYFGKHASELTLAESALIAGLPRGPSIYSPYVDIEQASLRRNMVLQGMVKAGFISQSQAEQAQKEPIKLIGKKKRIVQASYFLDYVANNLVTKYGANRVYKGGLKVFTTLDIKIQKAAEDALGSYQGAVIAIDPRNGYIKAMVGGRNYEESQINRVVTEFRQPGSAFKPFVYAAALNQGFTAGSVIIDEPVNIAGYAPQNYDKKYRGPVTLKKALSLSINTATVKLGQQVGMDQVLALAQSMGITSILPQDNNLAAALGGLTKGVNLLELTTAYTAFANNGIISRPVFILKVVDENNQILEEHRAEQYSILKPEIAYILTDMMKGVIEKGTGTAANIGRPAAGKTGTTDNYETAWFIGFTPELLVGLYVGNDDRTTVNMSGSQAARLWGGIMQKSLSGQQISDFPVPPNVITGVPVCSSSGKLATAVCADIEYSAFVKGTEPRTYDHLSSARRDTSKEKSAEQNQKGWKLPIPWLPKF